MSITMDEEIKRWTAKRKTALVMDIIQGKTTVSEAARGFDLAPSEIEAWVNDAKQGMENALRAKPLDIREQYEKQLKELQENVIDLEDVSGGVSITDLTLNDFRMNLMEYLKEHEQKLAQMPLGIHSVVKSDNEFLKEAIGKGTLFCLKYLKNDKQQEGHYSLEPYYLIFMGENNEVKLGFSNAKQILDTYKKLCLGQKHGIQEAIALFEAKTKHYNDMSFYVTQLESAIESIVGKKEEVGLDSLFSRGGTNITAQSLASKEEFELISYLVIE